MVEYKILTERDSLFAGRFDQEALEQALNSYSQRSALASSCVRWKAGSPGRRTGDRATTHSKKPNAGHPCSRSRSLQQGNH